jgi:hypothetical protein
VERSDVPDGLVIGFMNGSAPGLMKNKRREIGSFVVKVCCRVSSTTQVLRSRRLVSVWPVVNPMMMSSLVMRDWWSESIVGSEIWFARMDLTT